MTAEQALNRHFIATGILDEGSTRDDWYAGHWIYLKLGSARLPFFPVLRRGGPVVLHDLHHMLTGYAPDWKGEVELAGWELGSGGCGWHLLYGFDRLASFRLGLLTAPSGTLRAFARGGRCRNLFRRNPEEVLRTDVDRLRSDLSV